VIKSVAVATTVAMAHLHFMAETILLPCGRGKLGKLFSVVGGRFSVFGLLF
jgi:hypothetical protein